MKCVFQITDLGYDNINIPDKLPVTFDFFLEKTVVGEAELKKDDDKLIVDMNIQLPKAIEKLNERLALNIGGWNLKMKDGEVTNDFDVKSISINLKGLI